MTFLESDYMDRNPYRKLTVGLSHAFGGALLIMAGVPMWLVVLGYFAKEVMFDLKRVQGLWADRRLVSDSIVDWIFWWLGAAMVSYDNAWYGFAALAVGAAYFVAGKVQNGK